LPQPPGQVRTGRGGLPALAAAALALLLYSVTLAGTFVYDDQDLVRDDPRAREPGRWVLYLRQPYFPHAPDPLWRPLPSITYAIQWRIHGPRPWAFHLVNILLHAAVCALVAELARRMSGSLGLAYVAGLLFAAHPVHVEPVAMIVGRAEMLCALGVIGGLVLFHARPMTFARAAAIIGCFLLAVLSKEHGLLLAPMLLAWHLSSRWRRCLDPGADSQPSPPCRERQALLLLAALCCFVILGYIAYRESIMPLNFDKWFMRWTVNPVVRADGPARFLVPLSALGRYAALLLLPAKLSPDYGANVITYYVRWSDPYLYLGAITALAYVFALGLALRRPAPGVLACLLCLGLAYGLISNFIFIIGTIMGDRLVYLSSVFFILLLAITLLRLPRGATPAVVLLLLALGSVKTVTYASRWNDPLKLFAAARREFPQSVYLHVLEAKERAERGELQAAARILERGRHIEPQSANVWEWSAEIAERRGRPEEAQRYARVAFDLNQEPPHMPPRQNRAYTRPARR
jgi:hypothetical protein